MTLLDRIVAEVERAGVTTLAEVGAAVGVEVAALAPMVELLARRGLVDRPEAAAAASCPGVCGPTCGRGSCPVAMTAPVALSPPRRA